MNELDDSTTRSRRPAPFEHVFVATDFSAGAAQAIARAGRLPLVERGKVTIVHVLSDGIPKKKRTISRREGATVVVLYAAFVVVTVARG